MIKQTRRFALPSPKLVPEPVQETELPNEEQEQPTDSGSTSDNGDAVHDE